MNGVNKVILVATLGQDPEVKYMPDGKAVVNISVATSEKWKDKQGQNQQRTEWHRVVIFGKLGEVAVQYLKKGSKAYFEGKLQTRKWQDNNGQDRYTTEIVANVMQMLGDPGYSNGKQSQQGNQDNQSTPQQQGGFDDFDDDIPFS